MLTPLKEYTGEEKVTLNFKKGLGIKLLFPTSQIKLTLSRDKVKLPENLQSMYSVFSLNKRPVSVSDQGYVKNNFLKDIIIADGRHNSDINNILDNKITKTPAEIYDFETCLVLQIS